jgi:hypothetical protein
MKSRTFCLHKERKRNTQKVNLVHHVNPSFCHDNDHPSSSERQMETEYIVINFHTLVCIRKHNTSSSNSKYSKFFISDFVFNVSL